MKKIAYLKLFNNENLKIDSSLGMHAVVAFMQRHFIKYCSEVITICSNNNSGFIIKIAEHADMKEL